MSNQEQALNMVLSNIKQAFTTMNNFEVFPGLSLLHFLLVLLILHVVISLFTHLVTIRPTLSVRVEKRPKESHGEHNRYLRSGRED